MLYTTVVIPGVRTVANPLDVDTREDQVEALRVLAAGNTLIMVCLGLVLTLQVRSLLPFGYSHTSIIPSLFLSFSCSSYRCISHLDRFGDPGSPLSRRDHDLRCSSRFFSQFSSNSFLHLSRPVKNGQEGPMQKRPRMSHPLLVLSVQQAPRNRKHSKK